jgi:hypothetical protein
LSSERKSLATLTTTLTDARAATAERRAKRALNSHAPGGIHAGQVGNREAPQRSLIGGNLVR